MRCENCNGGEVTVVRFESMSAVSYLYCRRCETSAWYTADGSLGVDGVLRAARSIEPASRSSRAA